MDELLERKELKLVKAVKNGNTTKLWRDLAGIFERSILKAN